MSGVSKPERRDSTNAVSKNAFEITCDMDGDIAATMAVDPLSVLLHG